MRVDYKNNQWYVLSLEDGKRVISEYFFDRAVLVHLQTSFELEIKNNQTKTPAIEKIVSVKNSSIRLIKWEKQKNSGNAVTKAQLVINGAARRSHSGAAPPGARSPEFPALPAASGATARPPH